MKSPLPSAAGSQGVVGAVAALFLEPGCDCNLDPVCMESAMDDSRAFVKDVKRVVVKVGTAVVNQADGRLALGRLGAICEQLKVMNSEGYEVILVTCGAIGVGRQRLRYRQLVNSSFVDLQKPQLELGWKASAAVGQNGLMALYDTLFSLMDMTSAQLLVKDEDFGDSNFRLQLSRTLKSLLASKVIPVFNENDAISTGKAPFEDPSGIFWDNDNLAALLALELKADLLVLLSDAEGLYSGPPSDPHSKLIYTYIKDKHEGKITFGDKSRAGMWDMAAKVKAATDAAQSGIPVVITSGYATDSILKTLRGECVGTLFHRDAHLWTPPFKETSAREMAVAARESSKQLQLLSSRDRRQILLDIADALEVNEDLIRIENEADVAEAKRTGLKESLIARLALKPKKISDHANLIRVLANMNDPVGHVLRKTELADGLILEKTSCPIGVLLIIFESCPDALIQIASLAIRSGNGILLKGGKEAKRSISILHKIITSAIPNNIGEKLIGLVTSREDIPHLLMLNDVIDLVISRGSNELVSQIKTSTKIPILGHADGICHVYVDKGADMNMSMQIVLDAKTGYPAACNAVETVLVHKDLVGTGGLEQLIVNLRIAGVTLFGGPRVSLLLKIPSAYSSHHEYNSMSCTIEIVDDVHAAIDHIHTHGSALADCIITEDPEVAQIFLHRVDSAAVFHNASTRFCDGARFGLGPEAGISTSRIHARGPITVEGLLTTRWLLKGCGQVVGGDNAVIYTHKDLPLPLPPS